jgi:hypothetical protein
MTQVVLNANVTFMGLLTETLTHGIAASLADLIFAKNSYPNAQSSPGLASNHILPTNTTSNIHATM